MTETKPYQSTKTSRLEAMRIAIERRRMLNTQSATDTIENLLAEAQKIDEWLCEGGHN